MLHAHSLQCDQELFARNHLSQNVYVHKEMLDMARASPVNEVIFSSSLNWELGSC